VVEYFYSSSRTFGGALARTLAYQKLVHPDLAIRLEITADECCLVDDAGVRRHRHLAECFTGGLLRFLHDASDRTFTPLRIDFMHESGASAAEYQLLYGCPVLLGQPRTRVHFRPDVLAHEAWHADLSLQALHEQIAEQRLGEIDRRALMDAVMRAISQGLEARQCGIDDIARRLGLSRRRLQWRLEELGTNYNTLLDDYRSDLARELLVNTDERPETVAEICGFSDASAFYRAFRRWTGQTPVAFRAAAARTRS
jgi:AraC-like DNA-binding protein